VIEIELLSAATKVAAVVPDGHLGLGDRDGRRYRSAAYSGLENVVAFWVGPDLGAGCLEIGPYPNAAGGHNFT
jgi:hypothetical protein